MDIQNTTFEVINQHKNKTCHVQSLEKDFYLGTLGSFNYVFTHLDNLKMVFKRINFEVH
jgi:hypothetical protein